MEGMLGPQKTIGLVAHDNKKDDLIEWATFNRHLLGAHQLVATGTTGTLLEDRLGFGVMKLQSGPLGGDQQLGALIADGEIDFLVFFWDPLEPPRSRRQGAATHRGGMKHTDRLQSRLGRLHDLVAADDQRLRAPDARLPGLHRATDRRRLLAAARSDQQAMSRR